jgi:uncharacterized protein (TIGR00661 family)
MKILYAVQGTGNGHITRAMAIIPILKKHATVDVLVSGFSYDLSLPFETKYQFKGMSFCFGKKGGIDYLETYKKNKLKRFMDEVKQLDLKEYDFVVSDFEPISCWAAQKQKKRCIGFSNQASIFTPNVPLPKSMDITGKLVLKYYAPCTANFGIHFQQYNPQIFTPIISDEVRKLKTKNDGFYLVYLPAFGADKLMHVFKRFEKERFIIFSNVKEEIQKKNITVFPLDRASFLQHLANCSGVITAAGFSTTADALYLRKKLLVIPQKNQFEQKCNALALKNMGVTVVKKLKKKYMPELVTWMYSTDVVKVDYPNNSELIVQTILKAGLTAGKHSAVSLPIVDFNLQLAQK